MRLLADENIPLDTVRALRDAGHDVYSATESGPGAPDIAHIERALSEDRLILTFDRDFGELAVRGPKKPRAGVLLLRITPKDAAAVTTLVQDLFSRTDVLWRDRISVVDEVHVRQRRI
jgi:predicted nuclease of predicted toxin-antitoxin system